RVFQVVSYRSSRCVSSLMSCLIFFFQAEDGIRDDLVTGVQTCALPISKNRKKNNSAARLYPSLECFCTVVSSSSSSSCFSQQKHRKPARDTPRCGPETPGMAASPSTT